MSPLNSTTPLNDTPVNDELKKTVNNPKESDSLGSAVLGCALACVGVLAQMGKNYFEIKDRCLQNNCYNYEREGLFNAYNVFQQRKVLCNATQLSATEVKDMWLELIDPLEYKSDQCKASCVVSSKREFLFQTGIVVAVVTGLLFGLPTLLNRFGKTEEQAPSSSKNPELAEASPKV